MEAWVKIGLKAALASIGAVLAVQAVALAIWSDIAAFGPLDSYPRSVLFTLVPVIVATGLFAWLVMTREKPISSFIKISVVVVTFFFTAILIWKRNKFALQAAVVILGFHAVVMLILQTIYRDVVAPDSLRAMTLRIAVWVVILVLLLIQSWKDRVMIRFVEKT